MRNKKGRADFHYRSNEKMPLASHRLLRVMEKANIQSIK